MERTCNDCNSRCKGKKACSLFILDEHPDGHCIKCNKPLIWCNKHSAYHHCNTREAQEFDQDCDRGYCYDSKGNAVNPPTRS